MSKKTIKKPKVPKVYDVASGDILPPLETTGVYETSLEQVIDIESIREKAKKLCAQYIITNQSPLINLAIKEAVYTYDDIDNYKSKSGNNTFLLIYNDLAEALLKHGEMILKNANGTWWFTKLDELHPISDNAALHKIVNEAKENETS